MVYVDMERIRKVISDLLQKGDSDLAHAVWDMKSEYIRLRAAYSTGHPDFLREASDPSDDATFNIISAPASEEDCLIFNRWDFNLRREKEYAIERGSAIEWDWAQFVINNGPVTIGMVNHASRSDPDGWKRAAYELEEEG